MLSCTIQPQLVNQSLPEQSKLHTHPSVVTSKPDHTNDSCKPKPPPLAAEAQKETNSHEVESKKDENIDGADNASHAKKKNNKKVSSYKLKGI